MTAIQCVLNDLEQLRKLHSNKLDILEQELQGKVKRRELLKRKMILRSHGLAGYVTKGATDDEIASLRESLASYPLPKSIEAFLRWSNGLGAEGKLLPFEFLGASASVKYGLQGLRNESYSFVLLENLCPPIYSRLFELGCDKHGKLFCNRRLYIWLHDDPKTTKELLIFDENQLRVYLVSHSFETFLRRLAFCLEHDIKMNLWAPTERELIFINENEPDDWQDRLIHQIFT